MEAIEILQSPSGIQLSGSPIVFKIRINKSAGLWSTDTKQTAVIRMKHGSDIISEMDVQFDGTMDIDVSDSIAGWFVNKKYDCSTLAKLKASVKTETFTMEVDYKCKRTNTDGDIKKVSAILENIPSCTRTIQALEGELTEYAIYMLGIYGRNDETYASKYGYSLKPFSIETVNKGETPYPLVGGRAYYAEENYNPMRKRFFFINSNGLLESASLVMREALNVKTTTNVHKMYKGASFAYTPNISSDKKSHTSYQMSSGYCTTDWAEWFASEFAFSKHYWMEMDGGTLIPVSISMDSAMAYNKANGELPHIDYTVTV